MWASIFAPSFMASPEKSCEVVYVREHKETWWKGGTWQSTDITYQSTQKFDSSRKDGFANFECTEGSESNIFEERGSTVRCSVGKIAESSNISWGEIGSVVVLLLAILLMASTRALLSETEMFVSINSAIPNHRPKDTGLSWDRRLMLIVEDLLPKGL